MIRIVLLLLFSATVALAQGPPALALPRSPEVHADGRVTFRLRAPNARVVQVVREGARSQPIALQMDAEGVWSVTTGPLEPDFYGYSFTVDGARVLDTPNPLFKLNLQNPESLLHVPGPASLPWEVNDVPHGTVHHHRYRSALVGELRDFFVYTPPGYHASSAKNYPVLYLLHGNSDSADTWSGDVGRADIILDNLIARGQAQPMVVVMPLGYGTREVLVPLAPGTTRDPAITQRNRDKFKEILLLEVLPQVDKDYRVSKDRGSRAIAGLSMGGGQALTTGLSALDRFAWIGAFSAGSLEDFNAKLPKLDVGANANQVRLLWIACGTDDNLITTNRRLRDWLTSKGVQHVYIETPGEHAWTVWRRNLATFVPLLFRPQSGQPRIAQ